MSSFEAPSRLWSSVLPVPSRFCRARSTSPLLLACLLTSCSVKIPTAAPPEFSAGISYTNYLVPEVPWSIHVVRVSRSSDDLEFHCTHAKAAALGLSTLSEQINQMQPDLGVPMIAVNGDFYIRERAFAGDPRGLQILEGELLSAPIGGVSFWIDPAGRPHATNVVSLFKVTWPNGAVIPFGLNEERRTNNVMVLYTPSAGAVTRTNNGVELVLEPANGGPWLPLQAGRTFDARVKEVRHRGKSPLTNDLMVLSIGPALRRSLPALEAGMLLKICTDTAPDLRGVKTAISGGPLLVHEGGRQSWKHPAVDGPLPYAVRSMKERHPRTALGWNDQFYYFVEVDGRQKRLSAGMTLKELANFMISIGCQEAVNFDGGGSSMFWCNGRIVNSPCDRKERDIANALVVLRKPQMRKEAAAVSRFQPEAKSANIKSTP